ncbi:conserved hypothetical protein [Myxococcus xanthus DK 1622]|uniref:DUF2169 domain-containing protein n=2 Tax=Myxococcus xanthus TaxID=34 RepID=Q1DAJ9_MYXXD|nr:MULTISPECIES: DUF2169 domain-containing protein [Myxococcus]ABF87496.1 conserved hypothetical protein [Myxococcus xanthus DK 1622]NOJ57289.1 DUF2169 domain-containing protein [Myxococcus xanthus]QPM81655.1 DUF2169 domain-containing protein [Myxococcus xanthus]QVW70906.1 DUF2169 domain-containing protein [Myxococcus xanthus DZ2]QZZ49826.1 hypothetical protein MyxoNM_11525 [Myxococcus xanthus]
MLQVRNETPFSPSMFMFPDVRGMDTLYVVVKATFTFRKGRLFIAENQQPVVMADTFRGEPGQSSIRAASEAHLLKPGTDVLLEGEAHAPRGKPVASCPVLVRVGPVKQVIQVFGDRKWRGGVLSPGISSPEPFVKMPLVWERAYGGVHEVTKERVLGKASNPVGQGFCGKRGGSEMVGRALPNLEDPRQLIRSISDDPVPMGVGPVAPSWEPRKSYAGTYDEAWRTRRAPYLPLDFQAEFFQVAPAGMCARERLKGGEPVELINVSLEGVQRYTLPRCGLSVTVKIAGLFERPPLHLETVGLEPGSGRVCMTWRGAVGCDKRALKVEEARFQLLSLEGAED